MVPPPPTPRSPRPGSGRGSPRSAGSRSGYASRSGYGTPGSGSTGAGSGGPGTADGGREGTGAGTDALTIAQLYDRIDDAVRSAVPGEVWVSGEVRSFNVSSRGHCFLDLVDPGAERDAGAAVLKVKCWSSRWA
ncbi:MAG: exodeoxyribonuclease VII large subunit, partial [Actinomycetota bacterium]|nr:exodeoxyribonuclease VII large subunit [Actinomycetota bacterium]